MSTDRNPAGPDQPARSGRPADAGRPGGEQWGRDPQDWVDRATEQGTPPDYRPPMPPPGHPVDLPPAGGGRPPVPPTGPGAPSGIPPGGPPAPPRGPSVTVIDTSSAKRDGLDRCPRCGSTEIQLRAGTGRLICHFCRYEWNESGLEEQYGLDAPIGELRGMQLGSGATNQQESTDDVVTLKCQACGAEVVINTDLALQGRCHWCRHTLSINQQMPNGAVPDGLLPFTITRDDAIARIDEFVKARKFFAHPKFVAEFAPTEVVGVYLPYLTVDANAHVAYEGTGEVLLRRYTVKEGENTVTYYDADEYKLGRQFAIHIDDLMLESSAQRADIDTSRNTNNIINAIMPFDVKEAVAYNANYLRGFTSERRDLQVQGLTTEAAGRVLSIGRSRANELTLQYNRGIRWESESVVVHGTRWIALYLPVWLYSYYERRGDREFTHYVAVNGRTGATLGSVPVRQGRLITISTIIGVVGTVIGGALALMLM